MIPGFALVAWLLLFRPSFSARRRRLKEGEDPNPWDRCFPACHLGAETMNRSTDERLAWPSPIISENGERHVKTPAKLGSPATPCAYGTLPGSWLPAMGRTIADLNNTHGTLVVRDACSDPG